MVLLFLVLFVSEALAACGGNTIDEQANEPTNVGLKLKLSEGQTFRVLFTAQEEMSDALLTGATNDVNISKQVLFEVADTDRSGNYQLRGTFESFDLTSVESSEAQPDYFEIVVGESFDAWVSPSGEVQEVNGFDVLFENFLEELETREEFSDLFAAQDLKPPTGDSEQDQANAELAGSLVTMILKPLFDMFVGERSTQTMMELMFAPLQSEPVEAGDSWSDSEVVAQSMGIELPTTNEWEYLTSSTEQNNVEVKFQFDADSNAPALDFGLGQIQYSQLAGSGDGSFELDPLTGWPNHLQIRHAFTGVVEVTEIEGFQGSEQEITGSVQIEISLIR